MNFKIDENLPSEVADMLHDKGHDAVTVGQQHMIGSPDKALAAVCQQERRALITLDLDFADIRTYPPSHYPGLVVLRLVRQDKLTVLNSIQNLLPLLAKETLARQLWIVEENAIRIRE